MSPTKRAEIFQMFGGRCAYCGCVLPEKGWHADHVEPVLREFKWVPVENHPRGYSHVAKKTGKLLHPQSDRLDNCFPACRACNIDKSASPLESWRKQLEDRIRILRDNYSAFRHAERFGLVTANPQPVVFYFEKCREDQP